MSCTSNPVHSKYFCVSNVFYFLMWVVLGGIFNTYWAPCLKWVVRYLVLNVLFYAGRVRDPFRFGDNNFMFRVLFIFTYSGSLRFSLFSLFEPLGLLLRFRSSLKLVSPLSSPSLIRPRKFGHIMGLIGSW